MKAYVRAWQGGNRPDRKALSRMEQLPKVRDAIKSRGGPYFIKHDRDATYSHARPLKGTLERTNEVMSQMEPGDMMRIKTKNGTLRIYCVESNPKATYPYNNVPERHPLLIECYEYGFGAKEFKGKIRFGGDYNCRLSRQGTFWSMHSNWPPVLALDIFVDSKATGDALVRFLKSLPFGDQLVIVWWTSDHYDHVHIQIGGNRSGRPVCAG